MKTPKIGAIAVDSNHPTIPWFPIAATTTEQMKIAASQRM